MDVDGERRQKKKRRKKHRREERDSHDCGRQARYREEERDERRKEDTDREKEEEKEKDERRREDTDRAREKKDERRDRDREKKKKHERRERDDSEHKDREKDRDRESKHKEREQSEHEHGCGHDRGKQQEREPEHEQEKDRDKWYGEKDRSCNRDKEKDWADREGGRGNREREKSRIRDLGENCTDFSEGIEEDENPTTDPPSESEPVSTSELRERLVRMSRTFQHVGSLFRRGSSSRGSDDQEEAELVQANPVARGDPGEAIEDEESQFVFRGPTTVPRSLPWDERPIITPWGDRHWREADFKAKARIPNGVLGVLTRFHYPGMVMVKGELKAAKKWDHYALVADKQYSNLQERVVAEFWERYRLPPGMEDGLGGHAATVIRKSATKLVSDWIYQSRIQAIVDFNKRVNQVDMKEQQARGIYLRPEEYMQVIPWWAQKCPDAWKYLARMWDSPEWKAKSESNRVNKTKSGQPTHRQGKDSITRLEQRMSKAQNREVGPVKAYAYGHRSKDPQTPDQLCSAQATQRYNQYGAAMEAAHGEKFDWRSAPIDTTILYQSTGGKPHGRWAIGEGYVENSTALPTARLQRSTSQASSRRAQEESNRRRVDDAERCIKDLEEQCSTQNRQYRQLMECFTMMSQQLRAAGIHMQPLPVMDSFSQLEQRNSTSATEFVRSGHGNGATCGSSVVPDDDLCGGDAN